MGEPASKLSIEKLDSITFDQLLGYQNPFSTPNPRFDLTCVKFITPAALVQLAAACYALASRNRRAVIAVDDPAVRSYLMRAGFVSVVENVARFEPAYSSFALLIFNPLRGSNPL